jgi:outer membrane protein assembly factor BamB
MTVRIEDEQEDEEEKAIDHPNAIVNLHPHPCSAKVDTTQPRSHALVMAQKENRFPALLSVAHMMKRALPLSLAILVIHLAGQALAAADWPQFRGPTGDGQASVTGLPLAWSETVNVKWKKDIHDAGWSTPVVMGGQVWLTTATLDGHDFFVICLDADTGNIRFEEKLFHSDNPEPLGNAKGVNSYATPSPVIESGRVYVHFGKFGTAALDTSALKVLWKRDDLPCRHYRGPSSSPVLFEDLLILTLDGADQQYLAALNKLTGQTVWKTNRSVAWNDEGSTDPMTKEGDRRKAHGTPLLTQVDGKPQLLSVGAKAGYAYDPRTGNELWRVRFDGWSGAPAPLFDKGLAFFVTGYGKTELLAIKAGGQGDVTDTHVAWRSDSMIPKMASPVLVDGLLYLVSDDGAVTCLEAATGKQVWRQRIGGTFHASPVCADGRIYLSSDQGKTTVIKAGREFQGLATNSLPSGFMASPAVAGKALFLRTKTSLYRIESPK